MTKKQLLKLAEEKQGWYNISEYQKLSEGFIREFEGKVDWYCISKYQKLSEGFIREFADKVSWYYISIHQKLTEGFIREFADKVDWYCISKYQKLTEGFIREFEGKVDWYCISKYQKLSNSFLEEFKLTKPTNSWLYATKAEKLKYLKSIDKYEIIDDEYIIAYKSVREDMYSVFNFQYLYEIGKVYESHCDCNLGNENSFGLSAWTKEKALEYHDKGKLLKVKIAIKDIGAIVHDEGKIRCFKLEVLGIII